jgi:signal transduction histidine kinase
LKKIKEVPVLLENFEEFAQIESFKMDLLDRINNLVKLNQVKDEVMAVVAHDLKSPINQIRGLVNILKNNKDESTWEILDYIENACDVASKIINDLIEITEMDVPGYLLQKSLIDINDLVKAAAIQHKYQAREKSIVIDYNLCEEALALVEPLKISRMMDNLISNAIKFTPSGGHIEIITETHEEKVIIKVKDSGIGIHPGKLPFIFDRFSSVRQPGTMGEKSTGLGLSIVKKIVTLHYGKVSVLSHERKGSEFVVELPGKEGGWSTID